MTAYFYDGEPRRPVQPRAPAGAPNVVIVAPDDVGYAQLGCFGSDSRHRLWADCAPEGDGAAVRIGIDETPARARPGDSRAVPLRARARTGDHRGRRRRARRPDGEARAAIAAQ